MCVIYTLFIWFSMYTQLSMPYIGSADNLIIFNIYGSGEPVL